MVYSIVGGENPTTMAKSTGMGIIELSTQFENLRPDVVLSDMPLGEGSGARVIGEKYSAALMFPEVLPFLRGVNLWLSEKISNRDSLRFICRPTGTTIVIRIVR